MSSRRLPRPGILVGSAAAAALVLLTSLTTSALSANAQTASDTGDVAWSMVPVITDIGEERSNFAYALDPGVSVDDAVLIRNSGASDLTLSAYGSDAFTDDAGALDIATAEAGSQDIGTWITVGTDEVTVAPGDVVRVPFRVTIPEDARPGEHAGALLTVRESAGDSVSVDMRYATRVTVTVSGDLTSGLGIARPDLTVTTGFWPWEASEAALDYAVENTGNTRLSAVQLITAAETEVYSSPDGSSGLRNLSELLPASSVEVHADVPLASAWSPFVPVDVAVSPTVLAADAELVPPAAQQRVALSAVAVAPGWWVLLAGGGVLTLLAVRFLRRRGNSPVPAA